MSLERPQENPGMLPLQTVEEAEREEGEMIAKSFYENLNDIKKVNGVWVYKADGKPVRDRRHDGLSPRDDSQVWSQTKH